MREDLLVIESLSVRYGDLVAVRDLSLRVRVGECVALLGPNGAGKTTTLRAISGLLSPSGGRIEYQGEPLRGGCDQRARAGIAHVPEGRGIFASLSVIENMRMAIYGAGLSRDVEEDRLDRAYRYFPILESRRSQAAGTLSGGEQQMLALARALMTDPTLLVVDEMSLGLAPQVVELLSETLGRMVTEGQSILLVEQHVGVALEVAARSYVLEKGSVTFDGATSELPPSVVRAFGGGRRKRRSSIAVARTGRTGRARDSMERLEVEVPGWLVREIERQAAREGVSADALLRDAVLSANGGAKRPRRAAR